VKIVARMTPWAVQCYVAKREIIEAELRAHAGNATRAAKALGIQRTYLARLMRELGARRPA
jgi:DNA-binding NtrC family response regulator